MGKVLLALVNKCLHFLFGIPSNLFKRAISDIKFMIIEGELEMLDHHRVNYVMPGAL